MRSFSTLTKVALLLALALSMPSVNAGTLCQSGDDATPTPTTPAPTTPVPTTPPPTTLAPTTTEPAPTTPAPTTPVPTTPPPTTPAPTTTAPAPTTPAPTTPTPTTPAPTPASVVQQFSLYELNDYAGKSATFVAESNVCYTLPSCIREHVTSMKWGTPSGPVGAALFFISECQGEALSIGSSTAYQMRSLSTAFGFYMKTFIIKTSASATIKRFEEIPCDAGPTRQLRRLV